MTSSVRFLRRTLSALSVRNYRLFFIGQTISVSGIWMQRVAQSWLVLDLTGSGVAVGGVIAFQFIPILTLALFGGLVADRVDKRRLMFLTQALAAVIAGTLGLLVLLDMVNLWIVYGFALALGAVDAFDNPTRHAFLLEMVGREKITSAVGLYSVLVNAARILGPALAGFLIVSVGIGLCFVVNGATYVAVVVALLLMRVSELDKTTPEPRRRGQLRQLIPYIWSVPLLKVPLVATALVSIFSYEFDVILPLMTRFTFDGDAGMLGLMFSVMGVGAVVGGLVAASSDRDGADVFARTTGFLALTVAGAAVAPSLWMVLLVLFAIGGVAASFLVRSNAMLQLASRPEGRGRVLALRAIAFFGTRPLGALIVGWIAQQSGPRTALAVGSIVAAGVAWWSWRELQGNAVGEQAGYG